MNRKLVTPIAGTLMASVAVLALWQANLPSPAPRPPIVGPQADVKPVITEPVVRTEAAARQGQAERRVMEERAMRRKADGRVGGGYAASVVPPLAPGYRPAPTQSEAPPDLRRAGTPTDRETYEHKEQNPVKRVAEAPVSTFSIDVDTASYANMRRFVTGGRLPPGDAVRIEELINYFAYAYAPPKDKSVPFAVHTEVHTTPWNKDTLLLKVGIKGFEVAKAERPASNLVFLVDVSGSMNAPNKLPLVVQSLKLLVDQLSEKDRISLVVYAGAAGVVLEPTPGDQKLKIKAALDRLTAGGSTAGGAGLKLAYAMAGQGLLKGGNNRVIIATDGDFNVGTVNRQALKDMVARQRKSGIALTTLGFGAWNLNDAMMEQLAAVGNGNYAYIDTLAEARKVLVDELSATLVTIAKDVKIQIEFNPAVVAEYRLIGYENRLLRREDFANDKIDAGEIGAGHTVTAIYEIALKGSRGTRLEPLRYGTDGAAPKGGPKDEFAFLRLRYKAPGGDVSKLIEIPLKTALIDKMPKTASTDFKFAAAVAAFGQTLKGGIYTGGFGYAEIAELARQGKGEDRHGYRAAFVSLVETAKAMSAGG